MKDFELKQNKLGLLTAFDAETGEELQNVLSVDVVTVRGKQPTQIIEVQILKKRGDHFFILAIEKTVDKDSSTIEITEKKMVV